MRVLFLTYDLPYPLIAGGKVRAFYLLKSLAKKHQITLFSYYRNEEQRKYKKELKKYCQKIRLFKRRPPWSWQNLLRCFLTPLPFAPATYYSPELKKALIQELSQNKYDLVHFESFYPALYLPLAKKLGAKTLMGNENIEYLVYQRYAEAKPLPLRWPLKLEVLRMRRFEEKLWQQADLNLALSEEDAQVIKKASPKPCFIIPNGVDIKSFKPKTDRGGKKIIFIGTLIYQANNDAMKFFLKQIYPKIKKETPGVKLILVSWHQPNWLRKYLADKSIKFIQDKETPAKELLTQGNIFIAPIRIASGTNIKVLEAMAAGLSVVTTSVGIEGIKATKEVIIANKPTDFATKTIDLLNNKEKQQQLSQAGRELVKRKYDWQGIGEKLEEAYLKIVKTST